MRGSNGSDVIKQSQLMVNYCFGASNAGSCSNTSQSVISASCTRNEAVP